MDKLRGRAEAQKTARLLDVEPDALAALFPGVRMSLAHHAHPPIVRERGGPGVGQPGYHGKNGGKRHRGDRSIKGLAIFACPPIPDQRGQYFAILDKTL